MKEKKAGLLVQLDSLFDTRMGTIARISLETAAKHLHDPAYASRLWDLFPEVDPKVYAELYAKRDRETLRMSQTTPVVAMIQDFVKRCAQTTYSSPVAQIPEISINFYPYILTKEEKELIITSLKRLVPLKPDFKEVFFSDEELNPLFVRNNYNTVIHYHAHSWLEIHSKNKLLQEYKCPGVTMFAPARLDERPEGLEIPANIGESFYSLSIFAQLFINLTYVGIDNFCSFLAKKPATVEAKEGWVEPEPSVQPIKEPQGGLHASSGFQPD